MTAVDNFFKQKPLQFTGGGIGGASIGASRQQAHGHTAAATAPVFNKPPVVGGSNLPTGALGNNSIKTANGELGRNFNQFF